MSTRGTPRGQKIFSSSSTQFHELGAETEDGFGRVYRYCLAGGTALVVGNSIQSPAEVPNHQNLVAIAAAIGDKQIEATLGGTASTVDQYAGGYAVIDTTPGVGYTYPIRTHEAQTSTTGNVVLKLQPGWEVVIALTTTSRVTLVLNPYRGVIQSPVTTATGTAAGVAVFIIVAAEYGWLGVHGAFSTLIDTTITLVGTLVTCVGAAAGAVTPHTGVLPIVGHIMRDGVDTLNQPVFWDV